MGATTQAAPSADMGRPARRPFRQFTFPQELRDEIMSGPDWAEYSLVEADLTFGMTTTKLRAELDAQKTPEPMLTLLQRSIVMIGGKKGLDYTYVMDWMDAIGPKGRGVVAAIYQDLNAADASVGKSMLAEASSGWTT
jgi:hypothetical protein